MGNICASLFGILLLVSSVGFSQSKSESWVADLGNGYYKNPILHADYSDPDVCRVGDDFFMTASSFDAVPGLPILHSKDLVNWELIGHALHRQLPYDHFSVTQHGNGVWAPAIRYHNNEFVIYYPDPDFGIYLTKANDPRGPWSEPVLVEAGKGLIDPCPLWDDDGKVYLVHAYAGSRAGIKSILVVKPLSEDGSLVVGPGQIVYDGHELDPTVEGPKFHKRNGYYYILAPAGGVSTGWQLALRSKSVYGPYERKVVMDQGSTPVNGPHQGAWVDTPSGEDWFIHFQDKDAYGRIVHLQPLQWKNDWPVIGVDKDGDGKGEPVLKYKKPTIKGPARIVAPPESDEFDRNPGFQWQWQANPQATWSFITPEGKLRLYAIRQPEDTRNLWNVPNILMQKFPAEEFVATTSLKLTPNKKREQELAGLTVYGLDYAYIGVRSQKDQVQIVYGQCLKADTGSKEEIVTIDPAVQGDIQLRVNVQPGGKCSFAYSTDGKKFVEVKKTFIAAPGKWIGAKVGLFATGSGVTNDAGYADFDWIRITKR